MLQLSMKNSNELSSYLTKLIFSSVIVIAIVSSIITYSFNIGYQMTRKYTPTIDAVMEIKLEATNAYLWFEDILHGDSYESMDAVYQLVDSSIWYAQAMLKGGVNSEGVFFPLEDNDLDKDIKVVLVELQDFKSKITQRFEQNYSVSGSFHDIAFDKVFRRLIKNADNIEAKLKGIVASELETYRRTYLLILLGVFALTTIGANLLYRSERIKIASRNALEQSNLDLNKSLQKQTELQEQKNRQQEMLYQQSKLASMGEMIGNIAHQWRQPISIISMWANNIIADLDMDEMNNENLKQYANSINAQTKHLSQTIDDFRNFFLPNKEKTTFKIQNSLDKTMALLFASFKNHNIEVIQNIEDIEIIALENELTQALLNIIKNSKDALIALPTESKRLIFINIYAKDNFVTIEIIDNGGGIPKDTIDKIFEPYFTTKHKAQGTGIGLYMTESIIVKHLFGKIFASNIEYEYEQHHYRGANITIEIPLKA